MAPGKSWLDREGRVVVPSDNDKCVVSSTREPEEGCGVAFDQVGRAGSTWNEGGTVVAVAT